MAGTGRAIGRAELRLPGRWPDPESETAMPVLSRFYGIVIRMAYSRSLGAHFQANYEEAELVVGLNPLRVLQGDAPVRVRALVMEWAEAHYLELLDAWRHCAQAQPAPLIAPLA